ncbi:MAG: hypothetical protein LBF58_07610 [Deltaproteobacteria bacterium]|jgi:hypothetical protein|nr:hypothetical protein [Deltaproteobacteria bacterium]
MNPEPDSSTPLVPNGRFFVWPNICPDDLEPPRPCHYLTWPAWERFRIERLGQSPPGPNLITFEVEDPPNFHASLSTLLDLTGVTDLSQAMSQLNRPFPLMPFGDGENPKALEEAIRRGPEGVKEPDGLVPAGLGTDPAYLLLSLWACARHLSRQADEILNQAFGQRDALFHALTGGEYEGQPLTNNPASPFEPMDLFGVFSSWLQLASPGLKEGDWLWTPLEKNREEASATLARFGFTKVRIWPERSSLT